MEYESAILSAKTPAMLYMTTPHMRLTTMLLQHGAYARRPGMCPRCGACLMGRNDIIDKGYSGLWCKECDDE